MIGQSRMESLKEGAQNIVFGMGLNAAASWTGIHLSQYLNVAALDVRTPIGFAVFVGFMTVISMTRSYTIRRLNERKKFRDLPAEDWEAFDRIKAERIREVSQERFDAAHDDTHVNGELALAAAAYLIAGANTGWRPVARKLWPWDSAWFKPSRPLRDHEKAGALAIANMARIIRAEKRDAR